MTGIISPLEEQDQEQEQEIVTSPAAVTPTDQTGAIRELVLKAHPDVVPELIQGDSVETLLASVEPAKAAYARIAESLKVTPPTVTPSVPAGGSPPVAVDVERLPASEKIKRGLAAARR